MVNGGPGEAGVASVAVSLQVAKMDGARLVHRVRQPENADLRVWIPDWSELTVAAFQMETLIVRQVAATFAKAVLLLQLFLVSFALPVIFTAILRGCFLVVALAELSLLIRRVFAGTALQPFLRLET